MKGKLRQQQVVIVEAEPVAGAAWEQLCSSLREAGLEVTLMPVGSVIQQLRAGDPRPADVAVVVFAPALRNPVIRAREIRKLTSSAHFVFRPAVADLERLKYELSRAPMIGADWSLVEPEEADLAGLVTEAAQVNRRRARLRTTLDRANLAIGTPRPVDSPDFRRLLISDHYLRNVLDQAHDAIISLDSGRKVLYWSGGATRLLGLTADQALGLAVSDLAFWTRTLEQYLDEVQLSDQSLTREQTIATPQGEAQVEMVISSVREDSGGLIGYSLFLRDVTARNRAVEAEREGRKKLEALGYEKEQQRRLFDSMLSAAADQSYVFDLEGRFLYANKAMLERTETTLDRLIGSTPADLNYSPAQARQVMAHIREVARSGREVRAEIAYTAPSGKRWTLEYILVPVEDNQGEVEAVAGTTRDITERKLASERVWREANFDALTGLPNRRLFRDRLEQEVRHSHRSAAPMALFFVDLDRFKQVNDLHGHGAGDQLLREAAQRIRSCVRDSDTVARLGGDEFTVILSELDDKAHVENTAQKILDELAQPFRIGDTNCYVSGSIGITLCPTDAVEPADLIRNADQAMYIAKNNGRSQFSFFTRSLQEAALNRLQLLADLRHAVANGELELHFQPIADLGTGQFTKAEALLRWVHPLQGLLMPEQFIGLAEESGQIRRLGDWVFAQAASWAERWSQRLGRTFQVSVNKSAVQFENRSDHLDWLGHLAGLELPRHALAVEITESVLLNASTSVEEKLLKLREAGVELAIDDFGTGYSSMSYLQRYQVDYLKIDQSFVSCADTDESSRTIAESIVLMAHKLGLKVIAEGVETASQRDWLRSIGCDFAQGYFYSEPVPAAEFEKLLGQHAPGSGRARGC